MGQPAKPAELGIRVGQVLLGKYRVDAILGQGGMGIVAECMHLGLNQRRALKMLRPEVLSDADAVQRFMREAQAAVQLTSEYVAKVHDVGVLDDGVPYMEMEFLEGQDLGQLLEKRGALPPVWAVDIVLQTCEALAEAHSLGIVHRDIKPSNLFVTWRPDGSSLVKVLDFGISKSSTGTDMQLTQTQSLLGTPAYMSPEQMRSARLVDLRTDIWSLGTVMYEVLEGRKPFEAQSFSEMCVQVAVDPPAQMKQTAPPLQQVVLRCLEKSPDLRYAHTADLAHALAPFAREPHQAAVAVERMNRVLRRSGFEIPLAAPQLGASSERSLQAWQPRAPTPAPGIPIELTHEGSAAFASTASTPRRSRRRWPFVVAGLVLSVAGGVTAAMMMASDDAPPPGQVAPAPMPGPVPVAPEPQAHPAPPARVEVTPPAPPAEPAKAGSASPEVDQHATPARPHHGTPVRPPHTAHSIHHSEKLPAKPLAEHASPAGASTGSAAAPKPPCNPFDDEHGDRCRQ